MFCLSVVFIPSIFFVHSDFPFCYSKRKNLVHFLADAGDVGTSNIDIFNIFSYSPFECKYLLFD